MRQARLVVRDLQRLPVLVQECRALRGANAAYATNDAALRRELVQKDTALAATARQLGTAQVLGRDAENRAVAWRGKARSRLWLLVGETAVLVLVTLTAVR